MISSTKTGMFTGQINVRLPRTKKTNHFASERHVPSITLSNHEFRIGIDFVVNLVRANRSQEQMALLNCRRLPGRLNTAETAILLGFHEHDIAPLVAAKLISPLGRPAPNSPKYFAAVDVVALSQNPEWLTAATKALTKHWSTKNGKKSTRTVSGGSEIPNIAA